MHFMTKKLLKFEELTGKNHKIIKIISKNGDIEKKDKKWSSFDE
jgi:hypothetical protein